MDLEASEHTF